MEISSLLHKSIIFFIIDIVIFIETNFKLSVTISLKNLWILLENRPDTTETWQKFSYRFFHSNHSKLCMIT